MTRSRTRAKGSSSTQLRATDTTGNTPYGAVLLNDTFYNDPIAIQTNQPQFNGTNGFAIVNMLAMNNIFDGSTTVAVNMNGQAGDSQLQYNLFFNNLANLIITTTDGDFGGNVGSVFANPEFVGPVGYRQRCPRRTSSSSQLRRRSTRLEAKSDPTAQGNFVYPTVNLTLNGGVATETRTDPATLTGPEQPGRITVSEDGLGSLFDISDPRQILTLPGSGFFSFPDEWGPSLPATRPAIRAPTASPAPTTTNLSPASATFWATSGPAMAGTPPGTGYGSNPFMDIGAYQYVNLHPPQVTAVTETPTQGAHASQLLHGRRQPAGANQTPWTINITFNGPINPSTINANTVTAGRPGKQPQPTPGPRDQPCGQVVLQSARPTR